MTLVSVGAAGDSGVDGPTVVFLHGWGADERDLTALATYIPAGLAWASVRAPLRHPAFGYAWYPLETEESWDDSVAIRSATDALWQWVDETLGAEARIIPIGFSQGGLMASQLLRTRPERVHATVILSGYVRSGAEAADAVLAETRPRVFWGRGADDPVIPRRALVQTEQFLAAHSTPDIRTYPRLAHGISDREIEHLGVFLERVLAGY